MKFKQLIIDLIEMKVDKNGILLLIDYALMMGKITELECEELLAMIDIESYVVADIIDYIPTLYGASKEIDDFMVCMMLRRYVKKNVITQVKADEIKTACCCN